MRTLKKFLLKKQKEILFLLSVVITVLLGILIGIILVYQKGFNFPQIKNLEDIQFKILTVVHDDEGNPIRKFATEKRSIVNYTDIPDILLKAIVASEDKEFYSHWGINFKGTLRAIIGVLTGRSNTMGGGSSITQQLALNHNLKREKGFFKRLKRKIKEMLMAIQIEKHYSKDQILTYYCNTVPLTGNIYGVAEASQHYFGKSLKDINVAQAALIPSMFPNANSVYNVFKNPKNCFFKRNHVLKRMLIMKFITEEEYEGAKIYPLPKRPFKSKKENMGDYFVEETRKQIKAEFGSKILYTGGLKVYTTLNSEMQKWAEESLKEGLRAIDKRIGWRGTTQHETSNPVPDKVEKGDIIGGKIEEVNNQRAIVQIGRWKGILLAADAAWTKKKLKKILKKGDSALFRILDDPNKKKSFLKQVSLKLGLEQEPEVGGALLVVENKTGEIKAMVGGYSFKTSEWNNATQALRQPGSIFKPIIYSAAIENGYTPATIINDELTTFDNSWTNKPYTPPNDSGDYVGPITLRRGFQQSRNVISAKIVNHLTPPLIIQYARNFGITSILRPYMSIALGSFEVTLKQMVAAFTVFPNLGFRVNPFLIKKITNQNNEIIKAGNYYNHKKVLEEDRAYIMNYLLQGVVKWGTARKAKHLLLKAPIGGKTGTTNNWTNAWFVGFSPSITVGVWVGFDKYKSIGEKEEGSKAALPIFIRFMEKYLGKYQEPKEFRKPAGITKVKIDRYTGKLYTPDCLYPFMEAFLSGSEPVDYCTLSDHDTLNDYHKENNPND